MMELNEFLASMPGSYLFSEIARRARARAEKSPDIRQISLGIGDVSGPLVPAVLEAMHAAVDDLASSTTFYGYGPSEGYDFLREAVASRDYAERGIRINPDEIFITSGAKEALSQFPILFDWHASIAVEDPVYPVYVESNAITGKLGRWTGERWERVLTLPCTAENGFVPVPPKEHADIIYLCSPNNPTGSVMSRRDLEDWVAYAHESGSVIFYDSAYEAFISNPEIPRSIFEIGGADEVAVEFRSFSKTAGFTGVRCGYVVVPHRLQGTVNGRKVELNALWKRYLGTCFNGCSCLSQKAAAAALTDEGRKQTAEVIDGYRENARIILNAMRSVSLQAYGGEHAPYIWVSVPQGMNSWAFFDHLLDRANVVCTPGSGFGTHGEGYVRMTAFSTLQNTQEAVTRIGQALAAL
ncbi:MAG: LL-diaminopimelate aminotransferase [Desulfovibrionaceae bacterium]|nr:LL-diaminopimelate aminotransferase [Desulfovibrionaceae bacterium]